MSDQHPETRAAHGQGHARQRNDTHQLCIEQFQFADRDGATAAVAG
jgi:hypothetical protein